MFKRIKRKFKKIFINNKFLKPIYKIYYDRKITKQYYFSIINNLSNGSPQDFKTKIEVINLNATDICNSGCTMCNIWKQKKEIEFTAPELTEILKDNLFVNLKHVGITGGEPTLRKDLPQLFEAVIKAQPNISGLSTITNCIRTDNVINRIDASIEMCKKYDKDFSMMISLDGVGDVHDKVRGKKGNFDSAIQIYNYFSNKGISIASGTTISKINVWDVDDTLVFLKKNKMYGRFRVAEFIKRLYNDDRNAVIRNFDADETYHLILFFYKLIFTYETNPVFKNTYYSIINILSGGKRQIQCPYHSNGIVLNSKGEIAYCAPKSPVLGNALHKSAEKIYNENLSELTYIKQNDCDSCIHDYHAPLTFEENRNRQIRDFWRNYLRIESDIPFQFHKNIVPLKTTNKLQIFITGWYGTETVGDKAILAQIILELEQEYGLDNDIFVTSLFPHITNRTKEELNLDINVIDAYSEEFVARAKAADIVIMGGGPLMDLDELALPLTAFKLAKKSSNTKKIIYGCGLGPLFDKKKIETVKAILNLATDIRLRDNKSVELAKNWIKSPKNIVLSGDPAKKFVQRLKNNLAPAANKKILSCYLRELTYEYFANITEEAFLRLKNDFELGLANFIKNKAKELEVEEIRFEHMHNFVIGNDDRDFSRYFIDKYFENSDFEISYNYKLSTVHSIVESMQQSVYNICMRFHSVLFAETLDTDFTAVDYTSGGKIFNYLSDCGKSSALVTVEDMLNN